MFFTVQSVYVVYVVCILLDTLIYAYFDVYTHARIIFFQYAGWVKKSLNLTRGEELQDTG